MSEDLKTTEENYVSKTELTDLVNKMAKLETMLDRVVGTVVKRGPIQSAPKPMEVEATPDDITIPPSFRQAVDEILGKDFGCRVIYDANGSGFMFSILVPLEKSNAKKDYLETYKHDIRTRSLTGGEGLAGVREWCTRVRKNLERDNIKFPII